MKLSIQFIFLLGSICSGLMTASTLAQEPQPGGGRGDRGGRGGFGPGSPLMTALDTNGDGVIDEKELANAPAALKKLDKNGDGKLTEDELRPAFGDGRGGPGGRGGRGGERSQGGEGGPTRPNPEEMVTRLMAFDKNGDGKLSKDELPERMQAIFERADTNKDGYLTRDEIRKLAEAQAQTGAPGRDRR